MLNKEQIDEFEKLAAPLIEWMCKNQSPHSIAVIHSTKASVYSGEASIVNFDFIEDQP